MSKDKNELLNMDLEKIEKIVSIKKDFIEKKIDFETASKLVNESFDKITPEEFFYSEHKLREMGFSYDMIHNKINERMALFKPKMSTLETNLPEGHPIRTYLEENEEIKNLMEEIRVEALQNNSSKFIKNRWLELYDKIYQFNIHLSRKQNQLYSILETKGFEMPSRVMWSFDNGVKDAISAAKRLLDEDKAEQFMEQNEVVLELISDLLEKENGVLFPTSLKLISEDEFRHMRYGDDEIGYCLIDKPEGFYKSDKKEENVSENSNFIRELSELMEKYGMGNSQKNEVFDVSQGKLTLEQINLIYKHLPVDLSYVDENEIVKFYSDTKHRVFPRSAGVIGRDVKNCHPRESVGTVEAIIEAFRDGEQDEAEFWIDMKGKFIYIYYVAVRDEKGTFKGVLEMMQDVTKIRSLKGSRRLLTWGNEDVKQQDKWDNDDDY